MNTTSEIEVRFTLPIPKGILQHKDAAEEKAKRAYVLELLRRGDISAGRAAKLLGVSRWVLSDLMYEAGISPFDETLTAETLAAEVEAALAFVNRYRKTSIPCI